MNTVHITFSAPRTSVDEASRIDFPDPHRSITPRRMPQNSAAPARPEYTYLEDGGGRRRMEADGGGRKRMEDGRRKKETKEIRGY